MIHGLLRISCSRLSLIHICAENVRAELAELQVSAEAADELLALLGFKGSNEEILEKLRAFAGRSEKLDLGVQEMCIRDRFLTGPPCRRRWQGRRQSAGWRIW